MVRATHDDQQEVADAWAQPFLLQARPQVFGGFLVGFDAVADQNMEEPYVRLWHASNGKRLWLGTDARGGEHVGSDGTNKPLEAGA